MLDKPFLPYTGFVGDILLHAPEFDLFYHIKNH